MKDYLVVSDIVGVYLYLCSSASVPSPVPSVCYGVVINIFSTNNIISE